ncbi:hypothetical protein [Tahibacter caeni]|uniref:hypothetical protein n=1 Tax=Tahibacter caeni TaxID=1453545 RepID=UPI002148C946|nr:hypothetical protein [Tahibacter caeni]
MAAVFTGESPIMPLTLAASTRFRAPLLYAALLAMSQPATATMRCGFPPQPTPIPSTIDGLYIDLVTGATATTPRDVPGWDFNPFNYSSASVNAALAFFVPNPPLELVGILATGTPGNTAVAQNLPLGATVGANPATGFYNRAITRGTNFHTAGVRYLGLRFFNEATGAINYGWVQISSGDGTGAEAGFPASIVGYCYESDGSPITVGFTPVGLQSFTID